MASRDAGQSGSASQRRIPSRNVVRQLLSGLVVSMASMSLGQPRKKFQYSLRGLAIALTALIVWLGFHCNSAHQQATARRMILEQDGQAILDYQIAGNIGPW